MNSLFISAITGFIVAISILGGIVILCGVAIVFLVLKIRELNRKKENEKARRARINEALEKERARTRAENGASATQTEEKPDENKADGPASNEQGSGSDDK